MPLKFLRRHGWWLLLLACIGFVAWTNAARIRRIEYVTQVGRETPPPTFPGASDFRYLIVPEHLNTSYRWLSETQTMLERGDWRVRHTAGENAPFGRDVHAASPYRWWLAFVTKSTQAAKRLSLPAAVERAALFADPALHVFFLVVTTVFVVRSLGPGAGAATPLALTFLFPFGAGFLPGVPEDFSVLLVLMPWCVLPLVVGYLHANEAAAGDKPKSSLPQSWFVVAGCIGGIGLWLSVTIQTPLLLSIGIGALCAAIMSRRSGATGLPAEVWRWWGMGGAVTVLAGYLIEYAPGHLGEWELRAVHPLYGVAWLGGAEVLTRLVRWIQFGVRPARLADWFALIGGGIAAAALPLAMWRLGNLGFVNVDLLAFRLTKQTDGVHAPNLLEWFARSGTRGALFATFAPIALLGFGAWAAFRRAVPVHFRVALVFALSCLPVALVLAAFQLRWFQASEALALPALLVTLLAFAGGSSARLARFGWCATFALCLLVGCLQLLPLKELRGQNVLTLAEVEGLVERDLAHSLARRVARGEDATVLAPPSVSAALHYYAGIRGLSSLAWENKPGLSVALRIVISTSREEAHTLIQNRGVTHLLVPSWDPFFDTFVRAASVQSGELLFTSLQRWVIPLWLRPVPHELPTIAGFEHQSLAVFEVVEEQEPAIGMSRVADYFVEMGQLEAAKAAGEALRRYPADFSALIAQTNLQVALNDARGFTASLETIEQRLKARADRTLPWDRRVSLGVVLARGKRNELARAQLQRCAREATPERIRSLTTQSLYHLTYLAKTLNIDWPDPALRELAFELLPAPFRSQL